MIDIAASINQALDKAVNATGVLTGLVSISVLGAGQLFLSTAQAAALAVMCFGAIGALEVFHRQTKAEAIKRSKTSRLSVQGDFIFQVERAHPDWHLQLLKQFKHSGLQWNVWTFQELPLPITVTGPMCPVCSGNLTERFEVIFPARVRVNLFCSCGFAHHSRYFATELLAEAKHLAGVPTK